MSIELPRKDFFQVIILNATRTDVDMISPGSKKKVGGGGGGRGFFWISGEWPDSSERPLFQDPVYIQVRPRKSGCRSETLT